MKKLKATYIHCAKILGAVLLIFLIAGSVFDLPISKFMYPGHESSFGQFFAAFGKLPAFTALSCAGVLLFTIRGRIRRNLQWLALLGSAVLTVVAPCLAALESVDAVPAMPLWVALLVSVFVAVICDWAIIAVSRGCPTKTVLRFVGAIIFSVVATLLAVEFIKHFWARPRMRFIALTGNQGYFQNWWTPGSALKTRLTAEGVAEEEFQSFPSGHASSAACAMLLLLVPTLGKSVRGKETAFLWLGAAWTLLVAFARIIMGAHFLTDVTIACIIQFVLSIIGVKLFYFSGKFFRWFWNLVTEPQKNSQSFETE